MNHSKTLLWLLSMTALGSLLACYLLELNEALFYDINSTSLYLGSLWVHLTILGDGLIAALFMIPFLRKQPRTVWAMVWAALVFNVILHILKASLDVPRPPFVLPTETFHLIGPEYHHRSFPSGHTATAAAVAGVIAFGLKSGWRQLGLLVAASLIGLSRIGVGVHWPADVLAGLALGWLSAWIGWKISAKISIGSGFVFQLITGFLLIAAAIILLVNYDTHYPQTDRLRYALGAILLAWGIIDYILIIVHKTRPATAR
ncbi:phosphatase PAP2 family protein [candidate division KSB1 bacterium]|nr:phosphatase PAP2 family protein [candidate division KSB1 bacterium]